MTQLRILIAVLILMLNAGAQTKWAVDKAHASINFTVAHMVISEVTGKFRDFDATMESSKPDFTDAKITVTIKAKSIDTGNERRDGHLRSADFFNADVDSIITFVGKKMEKVNDTDYKLYGALTMRGVTKDVVLDVKFKGKISSQVGDRIAFKAMTTINRTEWGLKWNRTIETGGLLAGENVDLHINIEFVSSKKG